MLAGQILAKVDQKAGRELKYLADSCSRCHPDYLSARAHRKFSKPGAFDGLRIHTDELQEVISRLTPGTLSHAVVGNLLSRGESQC